MATQIYSLSWGDAPFCAPIVDTNTLRTYCKFYNQPTDELEAFFERFKVDEWAVMRLCVDAVYARRNDKTAVSGADAVALLGILATSILSDKDEATLQALLGENQQKFEHQDSFLNPFPDCPLWVLQIAERSQFYVSAVFFLPAFILKNAQYDSESYGYEKYAVNSYWGWYSQGFGKNQQQNTYWRHRLGGYVPHFIQNLPIAPLPAPKTTVLFDKDIYNRFQDECWSAVIDAKGIHLKHLPTSNSISYKYKELKIKAHPSDLDKSNFQITSLGADTLLLAGEKHIWYITADFEVQIFAMNSIFKKTLPAFFKTESFEWVQKTFRLSPTSVFFLTNGLAVKVDAVNPPELLVAQLSHLTGEEYFYDGLEDLELGGFWLLAGLGRLVFVDKALQKGYTFNLANTPTYCITSTYMYRGDESINRRFVWRNGFVWMQWDEAQNLCIALDTDLAYKIPRAELVDKLANTPIL